MWQAKIIAWSRSEVTGKDIITWELTYPRFIHSEVMTHRVLSRNAASSRAIPIQKVIDLVRSSPAMPVHWGKNQAGMQAKEELDVHAKHYVMDEWRRACFHAVDVADSMNQAGAHKQIVNRILEPFQWMKTVITGTEWENFYWLRNHEDAQPEFKYLCELMLEAKEQFNGMAVLQPGEWHTPYYGAGYWIEGLDDSLEDALAISMSCCAQVSYRLLDDSLEKAKRVVERLNLDGADGNPVHSSPSEHQATPMKSPWGDLYGINNYMNVLTWEDGITAQHKDLGLMSGNFAGWIQNRQLIPNNTKW
ncbi:MAG: FAD-dependent thymidylate synthase [Gammaproteobacteria bacterium]|nr:FAD-dependent thymidylate synthase [Gammaproteobacteria bacterium]